MQLYYSPFACSLAAHILCREIGADFTLHRSELSSKRVEGGTDLRTVNPMGQVPTLVLDDGRVLTENTAVLSYLADQRPELSLAPRADAFPRYELVRWLSFVGTEIHKKGLNLIFAGDSPETVKDYARASLPKALAVVDAHLATRETLVGETFTAADAHLFWALTIAPHGGVSLDAFPNLLAFHKRHLARPAVRAALAFEKTQRETPFAA